ncbi:outer membrane beta-barrel protein [Catalinimonas alkaloidigena]|uniref:outer membrane beta-barrel protein n=1 Tax=Catalinimonas alkaloidigena TaxID=1075417 RepID=UPI0015A20AC3|nr:outer membrane beta-barrel protein [Catalinimonas alkaloidigena]
MLTNAAIAQANFQPGYVVGLEGDTVSGWIDYRNWSSNPTSISFKEDMAAAVVRYTPLDVSAFAVEDEIYIGRVVHVDKSPYRLEDLPLTPNRTVVLDTVFLLAEVRGPLSLYFLEDESTKLHYFIQKEGAPLEELIYFRSMEGTRIKADTRYKGQLAYVMSDCPTVRAKLANLAFRRNNFAKVVQQYNRTCASGNVYVKARERMWIEPQLLVGASASRLTFTGDGPTAYPFLTNVSYATSVKPTFGVGVTMIFPRGRRKIGLHADLLYQSAAYEGEWEDYKSENDYTYYQTSFDLSYLKLTTLFRYYYPEAKWRPFVQAGIAGGWAVRSDNFKHKETRYYSVERIEDTPVLEVFRKLESSVVGGVGLRHGKLTGEMRAAFGNGMSQYLVLQSQTASYSLLLSYRF